MADLKLDSSSDLDLGSGLALQIIRGPDAAAQRIKLVLSTLTGEWFLDQNHGTQWREKVLGKTTEQARNSYLRERVRTIRGVAHVEDLSSELNGPTRALTVKGTCRLTTGELVTFEETN